MLWYKSAINLAFLTHSSCVCFILDTKLSFPSAKFSEDSLLSSKNTSNKTDSLSMARDSTLSQDSTGNHSSAVDENSLDYVCTSHMYTKIRNMVCYVDLFVLFFTRKNN